MKVPWLQRICPCTGMLYARILEFVFWALLVLALIGIPSYLVSKDPENWNALSEMLFQVTTALLSVFIGYRLSKISSEKSVTRKWLRPAQAACNQIKVMENQTQRLRNTRKTTCDELQEFLKDLDDSKRQPIEKIVTTKCEGCKARLADLQDHLSNAYETWRIFIHENCEKIVECDDIDVELAKFAKSLRHKN